MCPRGRPRGQGRPRGLHLWSLPQFGAIFCRNWWDLFVLTGPFSTDHPVLKCRWGDAKSRWGDADSRWRDASSLHFKY